MKRTYKHGLLSGVLVLAFGLTDSSAFAQDAPVDWERSPELSAVLRRLEAAEAEIRALRDTPADDPAALNAYPVNMQPAPTVRSLPDTEAESVVTSATLAPAAAPAAPATTYPTVKINGVFQADAGIFHQDAASLATFGRIQDGADFRRARLAASGAVTENFNYFFQMDFAFFGRPTFTDVWGEVTQLPLLGNVRVGQWKQPFSLEVVSSFRYTTFMERSLVFQPFTPFRHIGLGFYDYSRDQTMTWAMSYFRTGQDQYGSSVSTDGGNGFSERVTWLPWYDEPAGGRYYLHLGAGHWLNAPPNDVARFRTIPEFFVGEVAGGPVGTSGQPAPSTVVNGTPFFVDTGPLAVNVYNVLGSEALYVHGPLSVQSEMMISLVDQAAGLPNAYLPGGYVQVGYFLTGEHRPYNRTAGAIDRVIPFENFFRLGTDRGVMTGKGAWEVAARWSFIDLNDKNVRGGNMNDLTFGVNWFMNPYTKMVFNYIHPFLNQPVQGWSNTDIYAMRAQVDF